MDTSVLVCGAGSIGKRHARNLRSLGIKKISVCDPDEASRSEIEKELSISGYENLEQALKAENPDIVFVSSPSVLHIDQALAAAKTGAHLFIEKPLSSSMEGIDALEREVHDRKLICMVGCNMRFHEGPAAVKKILEKDTIGTLDTATIYTGSYLPDWRPHHDYKKSYSADPKQGGAILDCIHEIDLALWYFGPATLKDATLVAADAIGLPDVEGTADLTLIHQSGVESHVHLSYMEKEYKRYCNIHGKMGSIAWDFHRPVVEVCAHDRSLIDTVKLKTSEDTNQMFVEEIRYFLECVEQKSQPQGNLSEATQALEIALAAKKG